MRYADINKLMVTLKHLPVVFFRVNLVYVAQLLRNLKGMTLMLKCKPRTMRVIMDQKR
ncbi:hypothetical protein Y032_0214g2318, partial [Ancylostoma ceylanicum]